MATIQIECTCETCNHKWFYLPFEEIRMVMADVLRIRTRDLNWRERRKYFGRSFARGCGCWPGCGFAGCGGWACCRPGCLSGCGLVSLTLMTGPFSGWLHTFVQMYQIDRMPSLYRACPNCNSGLFKRVIATYEDEGKKRTEQSVSWQLPVINPVCVYDPVISKFHQVPREV